LFNPSLSLLSFKVDTLRRFSTFSKKIKFDPFSYLAGCWVS
jgi:hypothetical protein